ncbi:MAG: hypothetical protein KKF46_03660 [Nanoarchaeota archaeon]|nr:hypothetical protein [Nanoarchaeota archaeon]MBU1321432.1 hypothetical protein [Nanoarchaeota archaeon]MBU1597058.1 hypothetical protein [Nanoarchaeota archaeon]MBU2440848.1 hypothetical protein [Nanoarchaeota archaeon]
MTIKKSSKQIQKLKHSPTLNTILMVENTLKNMDESVISIAGLKKILPKQVNHNTLMNIIDYLDINNKIYISVKGITWIANDSPKWREAIRKASTYEEILAEIHKKNI